jgi:hypothetical protein
MLKDRIRRNEGESEKNFNGISLLRSLFHVSFTVLGLFLPFPGDLVTIVSPTCYV